MSHQTHDGAEAALPKTAACAVEGASRFGSGARGAPEGLDPKSARDEWIRDHVWYPLSRWYLRPVAKRLARVLVPMGIHPHAVSFTGLLLALLAAASLIAGARLSGALGMLVAQGLPALFLLGYWILDQADGHLARLTRTSSPYGAWLDANLDELVDVGLHLAVAVALFQRGGPPAVLFAALAFILGKYLFMFGLQPAPGEAHAESAAWPSNEEPGFARGGWRGWLRRLYHGPADADVRTHLLLAALLLDALWWELLFVAVYYNVRWLVRHGLMFRRHATARDTETRIIGPIRVCVAPGADCSRSDLVANGSHDTPKPAPSPAKPSGAPRVWISIAELEPLCQKPGFRVRGNWMARHVARPAALYLTRLLLPLRIRAHWVTLCATLVGVASAGVFALGTPRGWFAGAILLQLWYLLDHVDGQVARYWGMASVSGTYLDYVMHAVVHAICPLGLGCGLFAATADPIWFIAGASWSLGMMLLGTANDCRYKAFFRCLRHLEGLHEVRGGADGGPQPPAIMPPLRQSVRWLSYVVQKTSEMHVIMNALSFFGLLAVIGPGTALRGLMGFVGIMSVLAPLVAVVRIARNVFQSQPDHEFQAWFPQVEVFQGVGSLEPPIVPRAIGNPT